MAKSKSSLMSGGADPTQLPPPVAVPQASPNMPIVVGPEVRPASQVSIGVSSNELSLSLGVSRVLIDANTGLPSGAQVPEWTVTYSLSSSTAVQLRDALTEALKLYEERFGKIPSDPAGKMDVKGVK